MANYFWNIFKWEFMLSNLKCLFQLKSISDTALRTVREPLGNWKGGCLWSKITMKDKNYFLDATE